MNKPPTITDDRGIERPLWSFPQTRDGVPSGCALTAAEQRDIERSLRISWQYQTPTTSTLRSRLWVLAALYTGVLILWAALGFQHFRWYYILLGVLVLIGWRVQSGPTKVRLIFATLSAFLLLELVSGAPYPDPVATLVRLATSIGLGIPALLPDWLLARVARPWTHPPIDTQQLRACFLIRARCPSCAHALNRVGENDAAWLECAACGAAWRPLGYEHARAVVKHAAAGGVHTDETCRGCGYSLDGLRPDDEGFAHCPECGIRTPILAHLPGRLPPTLCAGCERSLRGQPLYNGDRVRCPDCGLWRTGLSHADVVTMKTKK